MDLTKLWIGDSLQIISKQLSGTFEGIKANGLAIIKTESGIIYVPSDDLEIDTKAISDNKLKLIDEPVIKKTITKSRINYGKEIDLHYDKLTDGGTHINILEFQMKSCTEFIQNAIQQKYQHIRIIHGKGEGKLKAAVESLLKTFYQVNLVAPTLDGGALDIWMKY